MSISENIWKRLVCLETPPTTMGWRRPPRVAHTPPGGSTSWIWWLPLYAPRKPRKRKIACATKYNTTSKGRVGAAKFYIFNDKCSNLSQNGYATRIFVRMIPNASEKLLQKHRSTRWRQSKNILMRMRNEILLGVIITNADAHLLVIIVFEFFQTENSTFPRKKNLTICGPSPEPRKS